MSQVFEKLMQQEGKLNALDITEPLKNGDITVEEADKLISEKVQWDQPHTNENFFDGESAEPGVNQWERVELELSDPKHWKLYDELCDLRLAH